MKIRPMFVIVALATIQFVGSGCVLSIDPIISDSAATPNPLILGTWALEDESGFVTFTQDGTARYAVSYSADGHTSSFGAKLGSLGGHTILDVWPTPSSMDVREPYDGVLVPGHLVFDIRIKEDELVVAALDVDSLRDALDRGEVQLDFAGSESQLTLLGKTSDLRAALEPYLSRSGAFGERSTWKRATAETIVEPETAADALCYNAAGWQAADQLFHRDPYWVGGDGSSTVDLGNGKVLWLFGDSWIDPSGQRDRSKATMVSNSVAIQTGTNPSNATMKAYWNYQTGGNLAAFIPDKDGIRHWFGTGVLIDDRLVLFLEQVRSTNTGLGFAAAGWTAWLIENPQSEPSQWNMRELQTPKNPLGIAPGFGASLRMDGYVYAFGSQDPVKSHPIFAARWPEADVRNGNLMNPEWWAGGEPGWVADSSDTPRWPLFENGQSGFTIHRDADTKQFLAVHTIGFGPADVVLRSAPTLSGPWSTPKVIHRPAEYSRPNIMIYTARAHPELAGADLILTYDTNSFDFGEHLSDSSTYYPHFVALTGC